MGPILRHKGEIRERWSSCTVLRFPRADDSMLGMVSIIEMVERHGGAKNRYTAGANGHLAIRLF